jgi:type IV pilus assembly protein PilM
MPALALDIGTYTIKALSGNPGKEIKVDRAIEVFNTTGSALPTDDATTQKLLELIHNTITDHKLPLTDVRLSLPETVVSTKIIDIPPLSDSELASAIGWQAEQHIPIPPDQLDLEYEVLYRPNRADKEAKMRVLLVGAHKELITRYMNMFSALGIEPKVIETQILSVIRSFVLDVNEPTTLIVHVGASHTQMAMVHQGELKFVTTTMTGGVVLTQAIQKTIQLEPEQAEQYKRTYGLQENQFEGKIRATLVPAVSIIINEIKKVITFFNNQYPGASTQRILLSGGTAQLPGLVQEITQAVGAEVLVAAPFAQATGAVPEQGQPAWAVCVGLMMREL